MPLRPKAVLVGQWLLATWVGCAHSPPAQPVDAQSRIAAGRVLSGAGVKAIIGSPVEVELSFKDGAAPCTMAGAVQLARDPAHRWVWLEPRPGCPDWLTGRWWAELAAGDGGWFLQSISTRPVGEIER